MLNNLEKNVYKYIAYRHNDSIINVKTNIRKSTKPNLNLGPKDVITQILVELNCT